jgi:hypothetical protein
MDTRSGRRSSRIWSSDVTPDASVTANANWSSDGITAIAASGCGSLNGPVPRTASVSMADGFSIAIWTSPRTTSAITSGDCVPMSV